MVFDPMKLTQYGFMAAGAATAFAVLILVVFALLNFRHDKTKAVPFGVWAVLGRPGAGKTYFATRMAIDAQKMGRGVVANYAIEGAKRADSWDELMERAEQGDLVIIDEAQTWWPSSAPFAPPHIRAWLAQVRKRDLTILWTAQAWERTSRGLRHLTRGVWTSSAVAGAHRYKLYDGAEYGHRGVTPLRTLTLKRSKKYEQSYDTKELLDAGCVWE